MKESDNIEEEKDIKNDISLIDMEKLEKIVCPKCGEIPLLEIDNKNYTIKSFCPNKHSIEDTLRVYIKDSNKKILSEENQCIPCSKCKKTNKDLEIKKNEMFLCNCGKYFCEQCKEKHEEDENEEKENEEKEKEEKENEEKENEEKENEEKEKENEEENEDIEHNPIKLNEKDFKCKCSRSYLDYICFCVNCNKNLCSNCHIEHMENQSDHEIIFFSDEIDKNLNEEIIEKKKDDLKTQKETINKFIEALDSWKKELDEKIADLKLDLKSYMKINKYILESFNKDNMNEQTIESVKKLHFDYDNLIDEFIKDERSFSERVSFLPGLLNYQNNNDINFYKEKEKKYIDRISINNLNNLRVDAEGKVEDEITSLCQIEKGLAVGDKKGKIHFFSLENTNRLNKFLTIPDNLNSEINYLCSLKNNYFISSNKTELKIRKLEGTKQKKIYNVIKTFKYGEDNINLKNSETAFIKDSNIPIILDGNDIKNILEPKKPRLTIVPKNNDNTINYQIKELMNENIVCIDDDKLMILKPTFNNNYIKDSSIEIKSKIISITEMNENTFCVYSENNKITSYDSKKFEKIENKTFKLGHEVLTKIEGANNDIIFGLGRSTIYIISIAKKIIIKSIDIGKTNIDMCIVPKTNKVFISAYYKTKNYLLQYNLNITKDDLILSNEDKIESPTKINKIYLYKDEDNDDNGKLIYIHDNNNIRILSNN